MDDIVDRLHEAYHTACKLEDGEYLPAIMVEAMIDAKVEIERLRAALRAIIDQAYDKAQPAMARAAMTRVSDNGAVAIMVEAMIDAKVEIERLRAALRAIIDQAYDKAQPAMARINDMHDAAVEALKGKD